MLKEIISEITLWCEVMKQKNIKINIFYNAIKTFSSIVFPLITIPYINRVLLPENVGKINFGLSIVSYFSLIATLGITTYAIRECARVKNDTEKLSDTASQIFSINICTTVLSYLMLVASLLLFRKLENYRLLICIQSLSIVAVTLGADWLNSALEDFKYIAVRTFLFQCISLGLMFLFVRKPEDYIKYALINLVSSAGANLTNIWYRRRYCKIRIVKNLKNGIKWKQHITPIMLLFVMILAQNIYSNVDVTMIGLIHGDSDVGIYSTANKAANVIFQVIISIAWVVMPRMSSLFEERQYEAINSLLRKVFGFYMLVGIPCIVGAFMLSSDIIQIIGGTEYMGAVLILRIIIAGFIFNLFGASLWGNIIFLPAKKEKEFMYICCGTAVINVIANSLFIPKYGAPAAATTTAFCNMAMFVAFLCTKDKRIKITDIYSLVITPIIGSLIICGVCFFAYSISIMWLRVVISVGVSMIGYFIIQLIGKNELLMDSLSAVREKLRKTR